MSPNVPHCLNLSVNNQPCVATVELNSPGKVGQVIQVNDVKYKLDECFEQYTESAINDWGKVINEQWWVIVVK